MVEQPATQVKQMTLAEALRKGLERHQAGEYDEALFIYRQVLDVKPEHIDALQLLGTALHQKGDTTGALFHLEKAAALVESDSLSATTVLGNLGAVYDAVGRIDDAIATYQKVLEGNPKSIQALNNLAGIKATRNEAGGAEELYRRALESNPGHVDSYYNFGTMWMNNGRLDEALAVFDAGLAIDPENPRLRWNRAYTYLLGGDFARGWAEYEWRWRNPDFSAFQRTFPQPDWRGEPLAGRTILVWAEQGLGDAIQFVRFAVDLKTRGAARVIVECDRSLAALFEACSGVDETVDRGAALPEFDVHCALLSLPKRFDARPETMAVSVPYFAPPARAAMELPSSGKRRNIGITWAGNPANPRDAKRSLTLEHLPALAAATDDADWISLQKGPAADAAKAAPPIPGMDWIIDGAKDFADTAAIIAQLDLVIAVDTAVAHLAGAMGKPVWLLIPFSPDWRWMLEREDSPWYPSMRVFRQLAFDEGWRPVVERVAKELAEWSGKQQ